MDKGRKIPIRIQSSDVSEETDASAAAPSVTAPASTVTEGPSEASRKLSTERQEAEAAPPTTPGTAAPSSEPEVSEEDVEVWRDRALRLQAEMENFRKRQERLVQERIAADRERLLRAFLKVADDLERVLSADQADAESLRQGVSLTYRTLKQIIDREGVEPIQAEGVPFDPAQHEAVSAIPHQKAGVMPETVVQVMQQGYRLGDHLLRPARVVVAT